MSNILNACCNSESFQLSPLPFSSPVLGLLVSSVSPLLSHHFLVYTFFLLFFSLSTHRFFLLDRNIWVTVTQWVRISLRVRVTHPGFINPFFPSSVLEWSVADCLVNKLPYPFIHVSSRYKYFSAPWKKKTSNWKEKGGRRVATTMFLGFSKKIFIDFVLDSLCIYFLFHTGQSTSMDRVMRPRQNMIKKILGSLPNSFFFLSLIFSWICLWGWEINQKKLRQSVRCVFYTLVPTLISFSSNVQKQKRIKVYAHGPSSWIPRHPNYSRSVLRNVKFGVHSI